MDEVVVDASAIVDLLLDNELGAAVRRRLTGLGLNAPAHLDAEVLSALGRLARAGSIGDEEVEATLATLAAAPIRRHPVADLLRGAWARRHRLRLVDAVYVELAEREHLPLVTTDQRLRPVAIADVIDR